MNPARSTSFLQPVAYATSPVTTRANASLSRIPIHLKDWMRGKRSKRRRPCKMVFRCRNPTRRGLVHLAGFGLDVLVEGDFEVEELFAIGVHDLVQVQLRS